MINKRKRVRKQNPERAETENESDNERGKGGKENSETKIERE